MATYFWNQITQANADAFNAATDTIVFNGPANQASVAFNPLTLTSLPSVTLTFQGTSVTFANDGAQVRGQTLNFIFTDSSKLYIGATGADNATGTSGADALFGGTGNDTLGGGTAGNDLLQGNQGDDTLQASSGLNTIFGGQGNDVISLSGAGSSNSATNFAQGNLGNDTITGSTHADTILGGQGDDQITDGGGSAADFLDGNLGNDTVIFIVGAGTSLANSNNAEVITDWQVHDQLKIGSLGAGAGLFNSDTVTAANFGAAVTQANTDLQAHAGDYIAIKVGSDLVVFADTTADGSITSADDAIVLQGRGLNDITAGDFI